MNSGIAALRDILVTHPRLLITPLVVFAVVMGLGYLVRRAVFRALGSWHARTQTPASRILAEALRGPTLIWTLILASHLAIEFSELPTRVTNWTPEAFSVLFIFSVTLMCMRIAADLIRYHGAQIPGAVPVTTLTQTLAQLGVLILGVLIILSQLKINIAPYLTALGVGGVAIALALQDTLSNLFAGFYVAVAGQVRLGDYIKMDTAAEGYITDISWRSTTIRTLGNNLIIVPNSKLAQAIVTNYHLPEKRMGLSLQVNVAYESDPKQVERTLLEVGTAASHEIEGMLADPAPSVAWDPGFGESYLGLSLNFSVAEFVDQFSVRNELRRRIFERFRQEGIEIPFPARNVYLHRTADDRQNGSGGNAA